MAFSCQQFRRPGRRAGAGNSPGPRYNRPWFWIASLTMLFALGASRCTRPNRATPSSSQPSVTAPPSMCPSTRPAPVLLPGVKPEQRQLRYWLAQAAGDAELDEVVLSVEDIANHNRAFSALHTEPFLGQYDLLAPVDRQQLREEFDERLAYLRKRISAGKYVDRAGKQLTSQQAAVFAPPSKLPPLKPQLRVAQKNIPLLCGPVPYGLYKGPVVDPAFDRNTCSTIRPQEPVRVLARWPAKMLLVRSRYSLGWIRADAPLSPVVPDKYARAYVHGPKLRIRATIELRAKEGLRAQVSDKTLVPTAPEAKDRAVFATNKGFAESQPLSPSVAVSTRRSLTRRAVLAEAFSYLDTPYGWGGKSGGRDCSRFVMDVFASFGLHLPRNSGLQALAGSLSVEVSSLRSDSERVAVIDAAAERGIVLLHFPGHIMLYLGRSAEGTPMAAHAFAEYLRPCAARPAVEARASSSEPTAKEKPETLFKVDRVQISDLNLGRGSSRRSFLERITHITLLARTPGPKLLGPAKRRPAAPLQVESEAKCNVKPGVAMYVSPRRPSHSLPVRVIVTSSRDLGSERLVFYGPSGERHQPVLHRLGGPPFGYWAQLGATAVGSWTARIGDGSRIEGCLSFRVRDKKEYRQAGQGPIWQSRRRWKRATENLYATFIEQLFDYPVDQDLTWPNLQELLSRRDKNLLYNHLGQAEDERLKLRPDCADLPYFLRAYFAWKMRLPFAFRHCNRGRRGRAPYCDPDLHSNLTEREEDDEVQAFAHFARRNVADGVHSGSGRTAPKDHRTDLYPVALARSTLPPGTVYADPYGHLLIVAKWVPQGIGQYGVLLGADAQPDGTIGRRRFWRGTFLFSPETTDSGAGFKAYRPLIYRAGRVRSLSNSRIARRGVTPFSEEQYQMTVDEFYERMASLINPRPLDPTELLVSLVDGLFEAVKRRVVSVANGERYKATHRGVIKMPKGHAIFETSGPWEDYSTPSRDMRLLIAIDTVTGFVERVKRTPQRFGLPTGDPLTAALGKLEKRLAAELAKRRFTYTNSIGANVEMTLAELIGRSQALEMAYNPNDCIEIRWGAAEGSPQRSTCQRHAPAAQLRRMKKYRPWFASRRRPAR